MNSIFVGNLSFAATQDDIRKLFEGFGGVTAVVIIKGKKGNPRGFAFVEMAQEEQANAAITGLQDKEFMGRPLSISLAKPRGEKSTNPFIADDVSGKPKDSKPWDKRRGTKFFNKSDSLSSKPWGKKEEGPRPYRKNDRESRPGDKNKGDFKSFKKFSASKPWSKKEEGARPYRKDTRESKPWDKNKENKGGPKVFKKFASSAKPARAGGLRKPWQRD